LGGPQASLDQSSLDQSSLSDYTILSMISFIVDASINLYDQCDRVTANIRDVPSDLMLPTKLGPIQLPVAEMVPKNLLGLSLGLSQPPSNPVPYQGLGGSSRPLLCTHLPF